MLFRKIICILATSLTIASVSLGAGAQSRPNLLIILADDLGYSDLGCYGGEIQTPHLDGFAQRGLRFTQFYNTGRCWPTRASLLTGYYAQQVNRDALPGGTRGGQGTRPSWAPLLPTYLAPLGYQSYHSGKWHVDGPVLRGGFAHSYSLDDHDRYFGPRNHRVDDKPIPAGKPAGGAPYYATTAIADNAIRMLNAHSREHNERPFFLYLAFTAPHFPLQALESDIALYTNRYSAGWDQLRQERFEKLRRLGIIHSKLPAPEDKAVPHWNLAESVLKEAIGPGEVGRVTPWSKLSPAEQAFQSSKMAVHAAMVHRMDIEIGRVLETIRGHGWEQNTLVLFLSDNGASAEQIIRGDKHDPSHSVGSAGTFLGLGPGWSAAANSPFRYHKSWAHEGGIATPLIVSWAAGISQAGSLRRTPGHVIDILPTLLSLAGTNATRTLAPNAPPLPGLDLAQLIRGRETKVRREFLWWYHEGNKALRMGDWKLVASRTGPWELYNLGSDRAESTDLADREPQRVRSMEAKWNTLSQPGAQF